MRTSKGSWQYVMATLLSTRVLMYELPQDASVELEEGSGRKAEVNLHHVRAHGI